jgi:hypothetical protein
MGFNVYFVRNAGVLALALGAVPASMHTQKSAIMVDRF